MTATSRKRRIAASFGTAVTRYDSAALVQRSVAERLARRVAALPLPDRPRVLEIGCGTGFLTRALSARVRGAKWVVTDISPAMIARCRETLEGDRNMLFLCMDGEQPAVQGGFDLICSSLAFQWFDDLGGSLRRLIDLLRPGGHLAFATLAHESLREWCRAHAQLGLQPGTPDYPSLEELAGLWPEGGEGRLEEEWIVSTYPRARDFVSSLKGIGACTAAPSRRPLSAGAFRDVLRRLDRGKEVRITYHLAYGFCRQTYR